MQIKNISSVGALDVPALRRTVEADEVVDVPDELAALLLEQVENWAQPQPEKSTKKSAAAAEQE